VYWLSYLTHILCLSPWSHVSKGRFGLLYCVLVHLWLGMIHSSLDMYIFILHFQMHNCLVVYQTSWNLKRRFYVAKAPWVTILYYFHDSILGMHLGMTKTWHKISQHFWPGLQECVHVHVWQYEVCQQAKPAFDTRAGLYAESVYSAPMESVHGLCWSSDQSWLGTKCFLSSLTDFLNSWKGISFTRPLLGSSLIVWCSGTLWTLGYLVLLSRIMPLKMFNDFRFDWGVKHITTSTYYLQFPPWSATNLGCKSVLFHKQFWTQHNTSTKCTLASLFVGRELQHPV
jgi:hypothetical protein